MKVTYRYCEYSDFSELVPDDVPGCSHPNGSGFCEAMSYDGDQDVVFDCELLDYILPF